MSKTPTIKSTVQNAIQTVELIEGAFTLDGIFEFMNAGMLNNPVISREQIKRALRDIPEALKLDSDVWSVPSRILPVVRKGRKTPAKSTEEQISYPRMVWNSIVQGTFRKNSGSVDVGALLNS